MDFEEKLIYNKLISGMDEISFDVNTASQILPAEVSSSPLFHISHKISKDVEALDRTRESTSYKYIYSTRKTWGRFIVFTKKVIRKLTFWYVEPICQQQTTFNTSVTSAIAQLNEICFSLIKDQDGIRQFQESMNDQLLGKHGDLVDTLRIADENYVKEQEKMQQTLLEENTQHVARQMELEQQLQLASERNTERQLELEQQLQLAGERNTERQLELEQQLQLASERNTERQLELEQQLQLASERNTERQLELEQQLQLASDQVIQLQAKLDCLDQLELDIFSNNDSSFENIQRKGTYSQAGEDMVIHFLLYELNLSLEDITYLDLGANHAKFLSNTFHFYKRGIRGVLVEANPALISELKFYRHGDLILNRCIAEKSGDTVDFYVLNGDGLSTASKESAEEFIAKSAGLSIDRTVSIETISVNDVIENYMGKSPTILNIDIEGNEMEVLRSIDFEKYRPMIIVAEMIPYMMPFGVAKRSQEILDFMEKIDYYEYAFSGINSVFVDIKQFKEMGRFFA